jgi:hypothetical protein
MISDDESISIRNCRFAFKCDKKWDDLEETQEELIRFCNMCEKEVHFCEDDDELARNVRLNRCVAFNKLETLVEMGYVRINKE